MRHAATSRTRCASTTAQERTRRRPTRATTRLTGRAAPPGQHMPHRGTRARYMREPSSHGLQATGRLRVSNYTRHATTPRATVLAPSGTGSALEGHSSGTVHVLYRASCPLRVPRRCWPRRLRPKASKRRAAARKYAVRLRRAAKTACHRLSSSARANAKRRPSTCAPRCHQPRTLRFYHGTRQATAPRCAAPATSSCSLSAAPHPHVRPRQRAKP